MKLAEALQERADLNRQIEQLRSRLSHNAIVQEGEAPAEDPGDLLAQLDRATARLEELMASINLANSRTVVNDKTLTQIIARKDCLRLRLEAYRELAETASQTAAEPPFRNSHSQHRGREDNSGPGGHHGQGAAPSGQRAPTDQLDHGIVTAAAGSKRSECDLSG